MNLKKLERATKLYEEIKVLDAEIIEIEKMAMIVANGETNSSFELRVEDLSKKEDEVKSVLDEEWSSPFTYMHQLMHEYRTGSIKKKAEPTGNLLKKSISETVTLQILGVLLFEKNGQREALISRIEKMQLI